MKSVAWIALALICGSAARPQTPAVDGVADRVGSLQLPTSDAARLRVLLNSKDYPGAETILLQAISLDSHSVRAARLLGFTAGVYVQAHDDRGAAIALSKADALQPLEPALRFTLAMSLIRIERRADARKQLERLAREQPATAVYPYWLGRLDYDAQQFPAALVNLNRAVALDPAMARAHDSLGLCLFSLNRVADAVAEYRKAIALDGTAARPSPWPSLNLGMALAFTGDLAGALKNLKESERLDPALAKAHLEAAKVLEGQMRLSEAVSEFERAAELDPASPEPHAALARLYRKQGRTDLSRQQVESYQRLKAAGPE